MFELFNSADCSNYSCDANAFDIVGDEFPKTAWLVSKIGRLTAGVQYEPQFGKKDGARYKNLANWSCAIGYGLGSGSPLSPSFNFGLELAKSSQFIASFYQHVVVQRRVLSLSLSLCLSSLSLSLIQIEPPKVSSHYKTQNQTLFFLLFSLST